MNVELPHSFETFLDLLKLEFGISGEFGLESAFIDDVGFDSLDIFELVIFLEALIDPSNRRLLFDYPLVKTVGDAYSIYLQLHSWISDSAQTS